MFILYMASSEQNFEKPKSRKTIIAVCGVLLALLTIGGCMFFYSRNNSDTLDDTEIECYSVKLVKCANNGDADAQCRLGLCYLTGIGVSQDYNEAVRWFKKSAEQGNKDALCNLGRCYFWGMGVSQDYNEAVRWFKKSAEQGNAEAQCNLGYCYFKGFGVSQDHNEAVRWLKKSAEQGNENAIDFLRQV